MSFMLESKYQVEYFKWRYQVPKRHWPDAFKSEVQHSLEYCCHGRRKKVKKRCIFYNNYSHHNGTMKTTTIQVDIETRDILRSLGRKDETYSDRIRKLIEKAQYVQIPIRKKVY